MPNKQQTEFILDMIEERRSRMQIVVNQGGDPLVYVPAKWNMQAMVALDTILRANPEDEVIFQAILLALGFEVET